jgi:hypothetical protein
MIAETDLCRRWYQDMSRTPTVSEVKQFVEELKDAGKLLDGCRRFHEIEPRDIAYVVCSGLVSQDPQNMAYVLSGIRVFLQVWNAVYIQKLPQRLKQSMEDDIRSAYLSCADELALLARKRLEDINLASAQTTEAIKTAFNCFARYESISDTGASKALHMLNPALFMMWDTKIRAAYSRLLPDELWAQLFARLPDEWKSKLGELPPYARKSFIQKLPEYMCESYLHFMRTSQTIIQALLSQATVAQLWSRHLAIMKDPDFARAWAFSETPTKMVDECNFVRWAREIQNL